MPTPTWTLHEEQVLLSTASSVVFNSIPGTYKDLVLEIVCFGATGGTTDFVVNVQVNNDTGNNYSDTIIRGDGTNATSGRHSNAAQIQLQGSGYLSTTVPQIVFVQLMSYANTSVNKTTISRANQSDTITNATVGSWRSTSAITSIKVFLSGGTFKTDSTFRLWGVA